MDWTVSFTPNDTVGMTREELERKVNPKIVLQIRLGKGFMGTAFPVLVEDMSFRGRMRIKLELMTQSPHIKVVEACFMEKPLFDYVLKPLGGETFGFDVNNVSKKLYNKRVLSYPIDRFRGYRDLLEIKHTLFWDPCYTIQMYLNLMPKNSFREN